MITDLQESAHGRATRWVPMLIALVNGLAPFLISLVILTPLWLVSMGIPMPVSPLYAAIIIALILIFLLGVFLGQIEGISWLFSGIKTLLVALVTVVLILLFA